MKYRLGEKKYPPNSVRNSGDIFTSPNRQIQLNPIDHCDGSFLSTFWHIRKDKYSFMLMDLPLNNHFYLLKHFHRHFVSRLLQIIIRILRHHHFHLVIVVKKVIVLQLHQYLLLLLVIKKVIVVLLPLMERLRRVYWNLYHTHWDIVLRDKQPWYY